METRAMPYTPTVVTPRASDYPELTKVWESSVRATHKFLPDGYIRELRTLVLERYLDSVMLICVKDPQNRIMGFAGVAAGKVEMLFVAPRHRGQGVGKQLLNYAIDELHASQLDVNEQNKQAVGFYYKQGFEAVGRSERDGMGHPYPILHLRLAAGQAIRRA
jgi:putative acetyltransferase